MKFRVAKNTFQRQELVDRFELKTLNQMDELPIYGNEPRVKCRSLRGPWQEVQINAHAWDEIDTPEFWSFVEEAVAGFQKFTKLTELNIEDHMPWKKLGQRWHFMRKGFPPGKKVVWEMALWEELYEMLQEVVPDGQFLWNNQVLVHLYPARQAGTLGNHQYQTTSIIRHHADRSKRLCHARTPGRLGTRAGT